MPASFSSLVASADFLNFASGLTGAIIGGGATLIGVLLQQRHQLDLQTASQNAAVRGFLQAIGTEIGQLSAAYMREVGDQIDGLEPNEPFQATWIAETDYFVVYRTGAGLLGHIQNHALRSSIVGTYIGAMGLLESYRIHKALHTEAAEKQSRALGATFGVWDNVSAYTAGIKGQHARFKANVAELSELLDAELS